MSIDDLLKKTNDEEKRLAAQKKAQTDKKNEEKMAFIANSEVLFKDVIQPKLVDLQKTFSDNKWPAVLSQTVYPATRMDCICKSLSVSYKGKTMQIDILSQPISLNYEVIFSFGLQNQRNNIDNRGSKTEKLNVDQITSEHIEKLIEDQLQIFIAGK